MILTAHQPTFAPWLGTFSKIAQADQFCSFDAVQMTRQDWLTRQYIKTPAGPLLLVVPVEMAGRTGKRICEVEIVPGNWARKHMRTIQLNYRRAKYFDQHFAGIGAILDMYADGGRLVDMNLDLLRYFMRVLGIQVPIVNASDYDFQGDKSFLVLDMCRRLGATEYIFGGEGRGYADVGAFVDAGVTPRFQEYQCKEYPQLYPPFLSRLSVIDIAMNCGPESRQYL